MDTENWQTVFVEPRKEWYQKPRRKSLPPAVGFWIGRIALLSVVVIGVVVVLFALPKGSTSPERHSNGTKYSNPVNANVVAKYRALAAKYRAIADNPERYNLRDVHYNMDLPFESLHGDKRWKDADAAALVAQFTLAFLRDETEPEKQVLFRAALRVRASEIESAIP